MTDAILALLLDYGAWLVAATTFLSCLAIPMPASLMMLAGGAFAAGGDLSLGLILGAAFGGAVAGDQTGYAIGRKAADYAQRLRGQPGKRAALLERARQLLGDRGGLGVFLSRWLFSPLGPYVNFIAGAAGLGWTSFTLWGAAGEAVWASLYTGLGYAFGDQIEMVADLASNISGLLAAGLAALVLGRLVFRQFPRS